MFNHPKKNDIKHIHSDWPIVSIKEPGRREPLGIGNKRKRGQPLESQLPLCPRDHQLNLMHHSYRKASVFRLVFL